MPGTSYGIPAERCRTGSKLAQLEGTTCHGCYAFRGNYQYASVKTGQARRFASLADLTAWARAMARMLRKAHGLDGHTPHPKIAADGSGYHRWHDAGDIQSVAHLAAICDVARATPELKHWLPTREATMLRDFIRDGGVVPDNLTIRLSATMIDGTPPRAWSVTSTVHASVAPSGHVCPAPAQGNKCAACRACWSRDVANVSYHVH
jgi:hypothetical protein